MMPHIVSRPEQQRCQPLAGALWLAVSSLPETSNAPEASCRRPQAGAATAPLVARRARCRARAHGVAWARGVFGAQAALRPRRRAGGRPQGCTLLGAAQLHLRKHAAVKVSCPMHQAPWKVPSTDPSTPALLWAGQLRLWMV